jgi:hypothetical protein
MISIDKMKGGLTYGRHDAKPKLNLKVKIISAKSNKPVKRGIGDSACRE